MGEFIKRVDLGVAAALAVQDVDFVIPPWAASWTVIVIPKSTAPATDPTVDVLYGAGDGEFYPMNPPSSAAAATNSANPISKADAVTKVRIRVTQGATPPDAGAIVELYGVRHGHF